MTAVIVGLHAVGWGVLLAAAGAPRHPGLGAQAVGLGVGLTAYVLGVRHAFDADHIAAIDNTTRRLAREQKRPASVGFWFALGHSSIVLALSLLLGFGARAASDLVLGQGSAVRGAFGLVGVIVSGGFLYVIAGLNLVVLADLWKVFLQLRTGGCDEAALERKLDVRGPVSRLLGRTMRLVDKPWRMYAVGLLFGLGFDTASEVALLVLAGSGAASGLPWGAVLSLPILFAAGMTLFDTLDGAFMSAAYGWAHARPARRIWYNLVVTGLSVLVAVVVGSVEVGGFLATRLNLQGRAWSWLARLDLNGLGLAVVGLFVAAWASAALIWRFGRIDERWEVVSSPAPVDGQ